MKRLVDLIRNNLSISLSAVVIAVAAVVGLIVAPLAGYVLIAADCVFVGVNLLLELRLRGMQKREQYTRALAPLLTETVTSMGKPVTIISEDNTLAWFNTEFASLPEARKIHLGENLTACFGGMLTYVNLIRGMDSDSSYVEVKAADTTYRLDLIACSYLSKKFVAAVWEDLRESAALKNELWQSKTLVAHIAVDNSGEIREVHENYRETSAKIAERLGEWAASVNGILTEYDQDKFILEFENRYLENMVESRFDILDKIAEISGDSILPLTISIGISTPYGTLAEKGASSKAALGSAYQRGGASVVVKTASGEQVYGGRSKPVQSQSPTRSRVCKEILKKSISASKNILIFGHERPDFDSIASCIGLAAFVKYVSDISPKIVVDTNEFNIRPVLDMIEGDSAFDGLFVDKVFGQELLTPDTLVIISDVSNPVIFEAPDIYRNAASVIIIDHHAMRTDLDREVTHLYVDPSASSASEMVCEICELEIKQSYLGTTVATLLLAGIMLDTNNFMRDTGARTFAACRYLSKEGAEPKKSAVLFKETLKETRVITETVNTLTVYRERFAISLMTAPDADENKILAAKSAERMVTIAGINASFVLYRSNGTIGLSARSDLTVNVALVLKSIGGGGHYQSAGATIKTLDDAATPVTDFAAAKEIVTGAIDKYIDSL